MRCVAVTPGSARTHHVVDLPAPVPRDSQVLVRMLEVGLCGTDGEINDGLYGEAPRGDGLLVLGHEGLGRLADGTLVVPMVRLPCPDCPNCAVESQDMCISGGFTERGIKGLHGMICEYLVEDPRFLIEIPESARGYGVLMEPMSVVAKGLRQAELIQQRLRWAPKRALVLGAGPIGLLATLALRTQGWETVTVARKPATGAKAAIAAAAGAVYRSTADLAISELSAGEKPFDLIFEATGSAAAAFDCIGALAVNGVLCLTSVTAGDSLKNIPVDRVNRELVLGNKLIFGTVNANRVDFLQGLSILQAIDRRFPGLLGRLFSGRVAFETAAEMFQVQAAGIKTVFAVAHD